MTATHETKSVAVPLVFSIALYVLFAGVVIGTAGALPDRVATHFNAAGQADGWMSRTEHVRFSLIFGLAVPFLAPILCALLGKTSSGAGINIPHRDYWLAHERRRQTLTYLVRQALWYSVLMVLFFTAIEFSILQANQQRPPRLRGSSVLLITGGFLLATTVWAWRLIKYFRRVPRPADSE